MNTFREKVIDVIEKMKGSKKLSLLAILLLVVAVPLTVFIAQQVQDIRQQANTNQATITVTPNTIAAGGNVTVNWTIAQPTTAPTATPVPATPTLSPTPSPIGCPMYSRGTPTLSGKTQTITLTPAANNPFQRIQFTSITNATVTIGNQANQTTPFIYEIPETEGLSPITFSLTKVTSDQAATVQLNVIDACGPKADTYGLGAGVGNSAYNLPSFDFVKKAYAQTAITGAETIQLFKVESNSTYTAIGAKRYLNCQAIGDATNPVPPSSPIYTGSCRRILIPADAQAGSYIFRMLATDGTTVIGESNVLTVTASAGNDIKSDLISYWSMNRDVATSDVAIDELSRNNGTILANTLTPGKIGNAHIFGNGTATDFIDIPNNVSLAPDNFTVSAWIFPTDANSLARGDNSSIFNRRNITNTRGMNFEIEGDATSPAGTMHCDVVVKNTDGTFNSNRAKNTAAALVLPGQWNHVACVYNGSVIKIFINGVMAGSVPLTGSMNNPDNPLTQIGRNLITTQIFKGKIDEVGYWKRGLSDAEIAQLATGISLYPPTETTVTPTITPTPTSTATAGYSFTTKLYLTGIGSPSGTFAPKHPQRNAVITLFDTNNNLVATRTGQISYATASRSFVGTINAGQSTIPAGNYLVKIQTPQFLRKQYPGILSIQSPATIVLPNLTITTGDVNGDNKIDILDYNLIVSCFGAKITTVPCFASPQFSNGTAPAAPLAPLADLNDDSVVDGIDYNLFIRSLSTKEGD